MAGTRTASGLRAGAGAVVVGLAVGIVAVSCESGTSPRAGSAAHAGAQGTATTKSMPYSLYTHCGVSEARIGGRYYRAAHPLSDGSGNPPAGWGNPYQPGTMTLLSVNKAVFTDKSGHRVEFDLRPGATRFLTVCS